MKWMALVLVVLAILAGTGFGQTNDTLLAKQKAYIDYIGARTQQAEALEKSILPGDTLVFVIQASPVWGQSQAYKLKLTASQKQDILNLIKAIRADIKNYQKKLKDLFK